MTLYTMDWVAVMLLSLQMLHKLGSAKGHTVALDSELAHMSLTSSVSLHSW